MSSCYDGKSIKDREIKGCPLTYSLISFMVAIYILLRLKRLNSKHFKCVSHPFVFYITAITIDNLKYFSYVIVTCIQSTILSHL